MPTYHKEPGRNIYRDGHPFVAIARAQHGEMYVSPADADTFTDLILTSLALPDRAAEFVGKAKLDPWDHSVVIGLLVDIFSTLPDFDPESFAKACGEPTFPEPEPLTPDDLLSPEEVPVPQPAEPRFSLDACTCEEFTSPHCPIHAQQYRCKHGTFIGDPGGPDYICGQCEAGD